jgi:RNA polymerase sigma factor for flagellar operon FliA
MEDVELQETQAGLLGSICGDEPAGGADLDAAERERLIREQLPQVHYLARSIHLSLPRHVLLEDLVSCGVLGLIDAIQKYDPAKNVRLKTYAQFRIRGAILDSLRELDWSPRDLRKKARHIEEARAQLRAEFGRDPGQPELAARLRMGLGELQRLEGELDGLDLESLDAPLRNHRQEPVRPADRLAAPEPSPLECCLRSEIKARLGEALDALPAKEREALALYYYEELTMKEVGARLGVGESRISQMHSAALARLRARMPDPERKRPHVPARPVPRRRQRAVSWMKG